MRTSREMNRLRRQMQRRISAVVAERRSARQDMSGSEHSGEPSPSAGDAADLGVSGS